MYLFWIIESVMAMNGRSHGHSHGEDCKSGIPGPEPINRLYLAELNCYLVHNHHDIEIQKVAPESNEESKRASTDESTDEPSTDFSGKEMVSESGEKNSSAPRWSVIGGILVGDCFHNFVDGLAIGVAWTLSWGAGLGKGSEIRGYARARGTSAMILVWTRYWLS